MIERRKKVQRETDRVWIQRLHELEQKMVKLDDVKERKRQRRHVIRHTCKIVIHMPIGASAGYSNDWSVDSVKVPGKLLDLSMEGGQVFTRQRLETSQRLRLSIMLKDGDVLETLTEVRWVKEIPDKNGFASGLHFQNLDPVILKKLMDFLKELEQTAGL